MRKITSLVLCILMLATLAVPAMAADVPTFVLTADMDEVVTGDIVTITVSVAEGNKATCSNFGVIVKYDTEKFELVKENGVGKLDNCYDDNNKVAGMNMGILADPTGTVDTNIFAVAGFPGVGAWNTKPTEGTNPGQSAVAPSGKVGWVQLKCIADTTANGVVDTTSSITGIASVDGGKTSTVTPVTVTFVESKGLLGDADGNGFVNVGDSLLIQKYQMGDITENDLNLSVSDVDGNGFYNVGDSLLIQKYQMGDIDKFPVEG